MKNLYFILLLCIASIDGTLASICNEQLDSKSDVTWIRCPRKTVTIFPGTLNQREILYQLPSGTAPLSGWPVVLLSQGSWFPVEFSRPKNSPFGGFNEVRLIRNLLDQGYAVVAPRATLNVGWMTNLPHLDYRLTGDFKVLTKTIEMIRSGSFGPLDTNRVYAAGISSGGYNTSRLALTFPKVFKALVIHSASYATCLGSACVMPRSLPVDHPPTRMLHGARDIAAPVKKGEMFHRKLRDEGIKTDIIIDPEAGHQWLDSAPELILEWFEQNR